MLWAIIVPSAPYWQYAFPAAILAAFGPDFVFAVGTLYIAKISKPEEQSVAGGLFQALTNLGTSVGLAVTSGVQVTVTNRNQATLGPKEALLEGYRKADWTAFGFGLFGTCLAWGGCPFD